MTKRFCPKCGVAIESGVFCSDCVVKKLNYKTPLVQVSEFNREYYKSRWIPFNDLEEVIIKRVQEAVGKKITLTLEPFSFEPKSKNKTTLHALAEINGQQVRLPVKLSYMQCDFGQKEKTQYYEGILQLRNSSKTVFSFIEQELKKIAHKGVFITKSVETKTGVDLYLTNKSYIRLLAQKIHAKFGGNLKLNPQLFSHNHQTSKNIYRLNVIVELPSYQVGDVIFFIPVGARRKEEQKIVLIKRLGKISQGVDLLTGKSMAFEYKFAKDIKVATLQETQVAATIPELLVLDPETFQAVRMSNNIFSKDNLKPDDKVMVAQSNQGLILVKKI
ncbi:hypothetical protein K9M74_02125 [Candidatus Woesearchaeota archaeon]|nr:hypothetical protein [Candidatus Woesearchaeota archaeon]